MSNLIDPNTTSAKEPSTPEVSKPPSAGLIDVRGPRFGAAVTTVVLAIALVGVGTPIGAVAIGFQTVVFALGAIVGLQAQPYGVIFRRVVRPRLQPPTVWEDPNPPRFAQAVGLVFALVADLGLLVGVTPLAVIAIAAALAAAFLNAAFAFCLGCEVFLIAKRLTTPRTSVLNS